MPPASTAFGASRDNENPPAILRPEVLLGALKAEANEKGPAEAEPFHFSYLLSGQRFQKWIWLAAALAKAREIWAKERCAVT